MPKAEDRCKDRRFLFVLLIVQNLAIAPLPARWKRPFNQRLLVLWEMHADVRELVGDVETQQLPIIHLSTDEN